MKYNTIVIDPPWDINMVGKRLTRENRAKSLTYKTMTINQIKAIPIYDYANVGCHIYLWTTNRFLRKSFEIFDSWNVNFHTIIVWTKPSGISPLIWGYQQCIEYCLLGFYGKPMKKFIKQTKPNWIHQAQEKFKHSKKPDNFYKLIESVSPEPRLDIFARSQRMGWDVLGDEIPKSINDWIPICNNRIIKTDIRV